MAGAATQSWTPGGPGPAEPEEASGWRCSEHRDRPVELFCRRCGRCVCALCPVLGAHRGHPVALAREEAARVQVGTVRAAGRRAGSDQEERAGRAWVQPLLEFGNLTVARRSSRR